MTVSGDQPPVEGLATAQQVLHLTNAVQVLSDRADSLQTYGRRTRRLAWGLAVSVTVDVAVSVVALLAIGQAQSAADAAEQNRLSQISSCKSTNAARAQNKELWDYVLNVPQDKPLTEAQRKLRNEFRGRVDSVFAPRDCDRLQRN